MNRQACESIIVALDCSEPEAVDLAQKLQGQARWLKVGMTLYYAAGPAIVARFKEMGFKVFLDLKLHDIPHQVQGAAAALVKAGADMLTLHCSGGLEMLKAGEKGAADKAAALGRPKPLTLGITVLTSMDASDLASIGASATTPLEQVLKLAELARQAGLSGVVASAQEAGALRTLLGPQAAIVTPGIRPAGSTANDQKRAATPAEALAAGASHLVIGRPITAAADPAAAFAQIAETGPQNKRQDGAL
jgi:orotidine-5'-phosphate decarboxylase